MKQVLSKNNRLQGKHKRLLFMFYPVIFAISLSLIILVIFVLKFPESFFAIKLAILPELLFPKPHINGFYKESHCGYTLLYIFLFINILVLLIFLALSRKSTKGHKPKIPFESFDKQCFFLFAISRSQGNIFYSMKHCILMLPNY